MLCASCSVKYFYWLFKWHCTKLTIVYFYVIFNLDQYQYHLVYSFLLFLSISTFCVFNFYCLFDGSVKDKDLFGTSEEKNVLMLLVIGSFSSLLCWLCLCRKKNTTKLIGNLPKNVGGVVSKPPALPAFKMKQFVFLSLQLITQLFASTILSSTFKCHC